MSVIDLPTPISHPAGVITEDQIRAELIRQLDAKAITGRAVADKLGIAPARVTEMKNGKRLVQQNEMPILIEMLGLRDAGGLAVSEDEIAEILAEVQGQIPATLPFAEWPRFVAAALKMRLDMLSDDRSNNGTPDRQA